jgi:hypothetical protein
MTMDTVRTPGRRVVRPRRSAEDRAYDPILADVPVELRPALEHAAGKRAEFTRRQELQT